MKYAHSSLARWLVVSTLLAAASGCSGIAPSPMQQGDPVPPPGQGNPPPSEPAPQSHGIGHRLLWWLPNRVFDVLDLVRARVRVGPGWTLSARATELVDVNLGAHKTIFVGLRGPRGAPVIPWPLGREDFSGVEVSAADGTQEDSEYGPHYGNLEVGLGFQFLIVGPDIGVDVGEALDFLAGVILFDPVGDDF